MMLQLFNRSPRNNLTGELRLELEGIPPVLENETLEQRVTRIFIMLRLPVYYYLIAFLGDAATADDLTQEVFLRLYAHLHRGRSVENVRFWVFRVAHNLAFDERQRHQRLTQLDAPSWGEFCKKLPDPSLDPEQLALQRERLERLQSSMQWLSQQERQCLLLRTEGLRYREIGEILGIGSSSVGKFLQRALRKLMKLHEEILK